MVSNRAHTNSCSIILLISGQYYVVSKSLDSGAKLPRFKSQILGNFGQAYELPSVNKEEYPPHKIVKRIYICEFFRIISGLHEVLWKY